MSYNIEFAFGHLPEPPPSTKDIFYHYCSMNSLKAILETNEMRLYDLQSMNDPSELYIRSVNFSALIAQIYLEHPFDFKYTRNGEEGDMLSYLSALDIKYRLFAGGQRNTLSFSLCLSMQGNSLSQWRLYGDNGNGVCLGFSKSALEELTTSQPNALWQKVEYIPNLKDFCINKARDILASIKNLYLAGDNEGLCQYQTSMFDQLYSEASQYKVNDYYAEEEYRLVVQKSTNLLLPNANAQMIIAENFIDDSMGVDVRDNKVRAFKKIPLEQLGLSSITLGPKNETTKQMLSLLLANYKIASQIDIYKSKIPYRG